MRLLALCSTSMLLMQAATAICSARKAVPVAAAAGEIAAHGVGVEGIDGGPMMTDPACVADGTMAGKSALTAALAGPEDGAQKAAVPTPDKADAQSFPCLSKPASGDSVDLLADGVEALSYKDVPITGSAPTAFLAADGHAYVRSSRSSG